MSHAAWAVAGTQLQLAATGSPSNFVLIPGVEGFQGPTGSKPDIDVTAIDDLAAKSVAGVPDYGSVTFDLFWDPANTQHAQLLASFKAIGTIDYLKVVCADAGDAAITFSGEVKGWEHDFSKGAAAKVKVSIKLSGAITVTP
jgi:hypothetical protein